MSDLISRADVFEIIDKAFSQPMRNGVTLYADICLMLNALPTHANSRSTHERDLISREDAIDALYAYQDAVRIIKALPSADAVHSEWIDVEHEPYCKCSVCGAYIENLDDDFAFCPRCGARMKGGVTE